ncbi:MAG: succinate dehydrogenase, hydrophobic membrane anchor protein [Proteobacteria bacterium]|nr:succinate dehydrogenase, hydrophobic membrane anchor protein [Pseudomonadota bacterium]
MEMRSQLGRVRGLGSTQDGSHHFWVQRLSGIALIPLVIWFAVVALPLVGADIATFKAFVGRHYNPVLLGLLIVAGFYHGQLGLQAVIEDYVHGEAAKLTALIGVKFGAVLIGACGLFAIIRLTFGS